MSFSLQFSTINTEQKDMLADHPELPKNIQSYVQDFDQALSDAEFNSQRYAYRILFVPKTANRKGQADKVIEFVKSGTSLAVEVNKAYAVIKETEKPKYLPGQIVKMMQAEGFLKFNMHHHTALWKEKDARNPSIGLGCMVASKHWHYYKNWVETVREHCRKNRRRYT